ncbi:2-oxoacid:ferredoxin oxidoreductase subunit beta [Parabacteroides sp. PF5-9]|uniref:2-oxoacid:ferredoxin oxidoreductase subunit beta n=1 Tax=Parabacteroides sp. PF5-9 TaxID=1742404 RepID=UPI00247301C4|nr:2-oxoacid:ferredoxin oxidoreductase subunit beta [Parabacteroides sp. PF5-9]MDH6356425.1 2-oxoglutarate ferredoxin oxidoreductase subunit beta [Parabacteroides sp. PF5-9]
MESEIKYQAKDYKSDQYVRWCPGCGDHAVLNCMHKAMGELGVCPENIAVISGIGCSSRLPYYMNTYGFHTIHGRAAAIATGVKTARPDLSVWVITGDGDCLAIGGNHFIHAVRRNVDLNIILFNNKIYGLTKGQYSPTSDRGVITKSSPYGTVEDPFIPAELALGARGNFFARLIDVDLKNTTEVLASAARHKGASVVEVLVNCVIFNDGIHKQLTDKEYRADRTIFLRHGEKMVFGKENNKGLVLDGLKLKAVTIGEDGYTIDDVLVHDAYEKEITLHMMLAMMGGDMPVALGIIRDVAAPSYEEEVEKQIAEVQAKNPVRSLNELLMSGEVWEVK